MRSPILAAIMLGALGCNTPRKLAPSPLTRADSARITAAFLSSGAVDSASYVTLREFFARRDSVEAVKANRRYINLRVF